MTYDHVLGFLGLVSEEDKQLIPVDYERPIWEIYRGLVKELLQGGDDEEQPVLTSVSFPSSRVAGHRPS